MSLGVIQKPSELRKRANVDDKRIVGWSMFRGVDAEYGGSTSRIGGEAIDRLCRKCDGNVAGPEHRCCREDMSSIGSLGKLQVPVTEE